MSFQKQYISDNIIHSLQPLPTAVGFETCSLDLMNFSLMFNSICVNEIVMKSTSEDLLLLAEYSFSISFNLVFVCKTNFHNVLMYTPYLKKGQWYMRWFGQILQKL